jgi:hypothetical protein
MKIKRFWREEQGAIAPIFAIFIIAFGGFLPLTVDLGHLFLIKSELQRAADVGALAGALGLLSIPAGARSPVPLAPDCPRALTTSENIVAGNYADGASLQLLSTDFYYGKWDQNTNSFTSLGCSQPREVTAVKVVVRKDQNANGPVTMFFAGLLSADFNSIDLTAQAVALVGYAGSVPPGGGALPLAVDENKVYTDRAGETVRIHLSPSEGDNGAWFTSGGLSGASDLRGWINGSTPSPALKVGDLVQVSGGVSDSVLQELGKAVNNNGGSMDALLPVIPAGAHLGSVPLLGFVAFHITQVQSQGSDKYVEGYTVPYYVAPGVAPGGPNYGLWSGVPKLVQ